jgi:hypothetical protein
MKKNFKFFALTALMAVMSMSAFAQEKATTVWRYTASGDNATLIGFVADLVDAGKADVTIPNQVTDPANASKKYFVTAINADAFSVSNDKGKLKKLTVAASKLAEIPEALVQDCGNLTEIDLSGATGLTTIPAKAFKGTKIAAVDLSNTKVTTIENWFGTTYEFVAPGGTYTEDEADQANKDYLTAAGKDYFYEGKSKAGTAKFANYAEINAYYKEKYGDMAIVKGDYIPYTLTTANEANKSLTGAVKEGDTKKFTAEEAQAYNEEYVKGAWKVGYVLDEITVEIFNAALSVTRPVGYELTLEDALAYNIKEVTGAKKEGDDMVDGEGNAVKYTAQEAYDHNLTVVAGVHKIGEPSTTIAASDAEALTYNQNYVAAADDVKWPGDINPLSGGKYTKPEAIQANYDAVEAIKTGDGVKKDDPKPAKKVNAVNNNTLKSVKLNSIWTVVAPKAFENCTALTTIDFGTAATTVASQSIGAKALLGTALTELNFIGTKVSSIPSSVFVATDDCVKNVLKDDTKGAKNNATLTTVKFNKIWSYVEPYTFQDCSALATVTFEDREIATESAPGSPVTFKVAFNGIGAFAFANTAIAEITIPEALDAKLAANKWSIKNNAFSGCTNLKSFTYMVDNESMNLFAVVEPLAFAGCKDVIYNTTNANVAAYIAADLDAPKNSTFNIVSGDGYVTPFKTVAYKSNPNKFYIKYKAATDIKVDKNEAKVYNAYLDDADNTLNMCLYRASGGFYKIKANEIVLIITTNKDLTFEAGSGSSAMWTGTNALQMVTDKNGVTRATLDYLAGADKSIYGWVNSAAGTGFQKITTGNVFPQGTMFILAAEPEAAAARLTVNWLDENGNIEEQTTGIESVINVEDAQIGEIYNLQGVRVNKANKGLYIQNGKKYVVK